MPLTTTVNRAMREDRETKATAKAGSSFFDNGWRKRKQLQRGGYALFAVGHTPQQNTTQRSTIQYNIRVVGSDMGMAGGDACPCACASGSGKDISNANAT